MQKTVHGDFPVVSQECMKISGGGVCVCVHVCVVVFFIEIASVCQSCIRLMSQFTDPRTMTSCSVMKAVS